MKIEKKIWPKYFDKVVSGDKTFEIRLADFECKPVDVLILREWDPETKKYTGRVIEKEITYVAKTKDIAFWPKDDVDKYGYQIIALKSAFKDLALKRRSIRAYKPDDVSDAVINDILSTSILAPSAGNLQAWEFILVKNAERKKKIASACFEQDFIMEAPIVIVVCANRKKSGSKYGKRGEEFYAVADACIVSAYIQLAAADRGLGSVWVGAFNNGALKEILKLPDYVEPVAVLPLGYPAEEGHEKNRMSLNQVLHNEEF